MNTQDLIRQWEGMSDRKKDWQCALIDGWKSAGEGGVPKLIDPDGFVFHRALAYTSPDSPRSLLDGLKRRAIEIVGEDEFYAILGDITYAQRWRCGLSASPREFFDYGVSFDNLKLVASATADQIGLACYLAVKGREGE